MSEAQNLPPLRPPSRALARAFAGLAVAIWGLMVLGALVRAHGAGLACPDWPLCFGDFVPRFDLKVAFEWSHRVVAASIGLLYLGLAATLWRRPSTKPGMKRLLAAGAVVLAGQVLLGALTVWKLLAAWSVTSHLLTANIFLVCVCLVAVRLFEAASPSRPVAVGPRLREAVSLAMALLIVQIALGGLVASKYAGLVCPEWPTCQDGVWFPGFEGARGLHLLHRLDAYALVMLLAGCAVAARRIPRIGAALFAAAILAVVQGGVGVANVLLRLPVEVTGLHSALAAALVAILALSTDAVWRRSGRR